MDHGLVGFDGEVEFLALFEALGEVHQAGGLLLGDFVSGG